MSKQDVRDLMSADYRKYVDGIVAAHPIQERNRAHYAAFESAAQLGSMVRNVRLKSGKIEKGRVVFYAPDTDASARMGEEMIQVWWQGCMMPAVINAHKVRAL